MLNPSQNTNVYYIKFNNWENSIASCWRAKYIKTHIQSSLMASQRREEVQNLKEEH
jgi:hypothetical protein